MSHFGDESSEVGGHSVQVTVKSALESQMWPLFLFYQRGSYVNTSGWHVAQTACSSWQSAQSNAKFKVKPHNVSTTLSAYTAVW